MGEIRIKLQKLLLTKYVFGIIAVVLLFVASLLFYNNNFIFKVICIISLFILIVYIIVVLFKLQKLSLFLKIIKDQKVDTIRYIENSIFLDEIIVSLSFNKFVKTHYGDIELARHVSNVFEVTRPGYKGNHQVYIQSNESEIFIPVADGETAEKILNFLQTKNDKIVFQNKVKVSEFHVTQLTDLSNSSVKGRF